MLVQQHHVVLGGQRAVHDVQQAVRAIVPLRALAGRKPVLRGERRLAVLAQEREVPQLLGVATDDGALGAIEQRQCAGDVALRRLVHDYHVEHLASQRQELGGVGIRHGPNREGIEQRREIQLGEDLVLLGRAARFERRLEERQRAPVQPQRVRQRVAPPRREQLADQRPAVHTQARMAGEQGIDLIVQGELVLDVRQLCACLLAPDHRAEPI